MLNLDEIKDAIESAAPCSKIEALCAQANIKLSDRGFAWTYAATLLAVRNLIEEAIQFYSRNENDYFCSVVREYLAHTKSFTFGFTIFADASPYRAWFESRFHKQFQPGYVREVEIFAKKHPPPVNNGCIAKTQDMTTDQWKIIEQARPIWFTNISLALHHIRYETKLQVFKKISTVTPHCLFGDANWSDELPKDSPELVSITAKYYGLIFEDILTSPASMEDQKSAIYSFLLPEAISILKEEMPNRTDYHMTLAQWKQLAEETGFSIEHATMTTHLQNHPIAFASWWVSTQYS